MKLGLLLAVSGFLSVFTFAQAPNATLLSSRDIVVSSISFTVGAMSVSCGVLVSVRPTTSNVEAFKVAISYVASDGSLATASQIVERSSDGWSHAMFPYPTAIAASVVVTELIASQTLVFQ